jgi:hypothetical protein
MKTLAQEVRNVLDEAKLKRGIEGLPS